MSTAQALTLTVSLIALVLSGYVGLKGLQRDRHKMRIYFQMRSDEDGDQLDVHVVNAAPRPITVRAVSFFFDDGGAYLPAPTEIVLPRRLEDGEPVTFTFHLADVDAAVDGFEVLDTNLNRYSQEFTADFRRQMDLFQHMVKQARKNANEADES